MEKAVVKVVSKAEKQGRDYVRVLEITDMIDGSVVKTKSKSRAGCKRSETIQLGKIYDKYYTGAVTCNFKWRNLTDEHGYIIYEMGA